MKYHFQKWTSDTVRYKTYVIYFASYQAIICSVRKETVGTEALAEASVKLAVAL
jgi:hypothetical protein